MVAGTADLDTVIGIAANSAEPKADVPKPRLKQKGFYSEGREWSPFFVFTAAGTGRLAL